ncbi:hypothetical protein AZE42_07975 [Rhizopogon vesiculosus]|uniref:DUF6533 domain-containing protein n=1 Tax=Rhizopogon vesiculosus TaxID=180088 RepID=A0A1J8R3L5_9AGAM|nr:hypothetical protein AZE42_07975 [Rhizopogon vesiculosus]
MLTDTGVLLVDDIRNSFKSRENATVHILVETFCIKPPSYTRSSRTIIRKLQAESDSERVRQITSHALLDAINLTIPAMPSHSRPSPTLYSHPASALPHRMNKHSAPNANGRYHPADRALVQIQFFDVSSIVMSIQEDVNRLYWNNYISVPVLTLISYEYLLLFEKEVKYVWKRKWSLMSCLYLVVRYLGLFLALLSGCCYALVVLLEWGYSVYFYFAEVILIWRIYALYNRSKRLLYVLLGFFLPIVALSIGTDVYLYSRRSAFSVIEIVTPNATYCQASFIVGPMVMIYTSIPIICFDIFLVVLVAIILVKHLKERRKIKMRPNTYVILIARYHIMYFILNLTNQIVLTIMWADISIPVMSFSELFMGAAPFILAPRLIISIWDTHAHDQCRHVETTFADCVCWTSSISEEHDIDSMVLYSLNCSTQKELPEYTSNTHILKS